MPTVSPLDLLAAPGLSFLLAAGAVPLLGRLAARVGLVDRPGAAAHKGHRQITPYGGGVAVWLSTAAAAGLLVGRSDGAAGSLAALGAAASAMLVAGVLDDWRPLPALPRLLFQLLVTSALVGLYPQFRLPLGGPLLAVPATVLWIVALTNAFNFLDNMDGLAAGLAAIASLALALAAWSSGAGQTVVVSLALAGALLAFLLYNRPPASVFMGDAGGLFLGFALGSQAAALCGRLAAGQPSAAWLALLAAFAIPAYDLITVTALRLWRGVAPWVGDNRHLSHRLVAAGLSRPRAVLVIHGLAALTALPAVLSPWHSGWAVLLLTLGAAAAAVGLLERLPRSPGAAPLDGARPGRSD
jgi:UDP-GlcNAc:undecaprenyl-phosphate GlcNAc-1-phosphate transferase